MTQEDLNRMLDSIDVHYQNMIEKLKRDQKTKRQSLLDLWAEQNARFRKGDIIETQTDIRIRIENISGQTDILKKPYVVYSGPQLTKKLNVMKKGNPNFPVYDDGREISLIKEKERG